MPGNNRVEHPACDCDLERDQLSREVWAACPDSGCLRTFCRFCSPEPEHLQPHGSP